MLRKSSIFVFLAILAGISVGFGFFAGGKTTAREKSFAERAAETKLKPEETAGTYIFDRAHTAIGFRIKHLGLVDVPGYFRDFQGTVVYNPKDITKSSVNFTAKATSVDTGIQGRDNHLRNADFFEVEKYPEISFKSTKVEKKGKNMILHGDFTMKGVTKQISFPFQITGFVKDQRGATKMGIVAETVINRRDYGINYGSNLPNGTPMIADNVNVNLQIEANLQQAK